MCSTLSTARSIEWQDDRIASHEKLLQFIVTISKCYPDPIRKHLTAGLNSKSLGERFLDKAFFQTERRSNLDELLKQALAN